MCFPLVPPTDLWISQTNGDFPASTTFIEEALNFHFCGPPESFRVHALSNFVFRTSVASVSVKNHLCTIGVFAVQGTIFRLHPSAAAARSAVRRAAGASVSSKNFEFASSPSTDSGPLDKPSSDSGPVNNSGAPELIEPTIPLEPSNPNGDFLNLDESPPFCFGPHRCGLVSRVGGSRSHAWLRRGLP